MYDDIRQVLGQLEKNGVAITVRCDHLVWRVATADGDEMINCNSSREVLTFLAGVLFATTIGQQLNA
jgi:hypothetical protein